MEKLIVKLTLVAALVTSNLAHAQIPVTDALGLAQSIAQVQAWTQQYTQMVTTIQQYKTMIDQAKALADNMTGQRLLGMIANEIATDATIPADVQNMLAALEMPSDITAAIKQITNKALQTSGKRGDQIQSLMKLINSTTDPKAIAELQARIGAETANVQNDTNRILLAQTEAAMKERDQKELFATYHTSVYGRYGEGFGGAQIKVDGE